MPTIHHLNRFATLAMATAFSGLVLVSQAAEAQASARSDKMGTTVACNQARQFAWFKRQLELTDGDTNPYVKIETPAECLRAPGLGANAQDLESKSASASRSAPATSEIAQNSIPAWRQRTIE